MQAGRLNQLLTLEEPSQTVVAGVATPVWTVKATVWGRLEAEDGGEGELTATANYRAKIRYRTDITSRWRVGVPETGRKLQILNPPQDPTGDHRELRFRVAETKS